MDSSERQKKLYKLAEEDKIYMVWKNSFELFYADFQTYAKSQPDEIRNVLFGYADVGRMMMQKMVNIACEKMEFIDKEE